MSEQEIRQHALELMSGDIRAQDAAARKLLRTGRQITPVLNIMLRTERKAMRRNRMLDAFSKLGVLALPVFVNALTDSNELVREFAVRLIGELKKKAMTCVNEVVPKLKDESAIVRASTAEALGNIGDQSVLTVGPLINALKDEPQVCAKAKGALEKMGARALHSLRAALEREQDASLKTKIQGIIREIERRQSLNLGERRDFERQAFRPPTAAQRPSRPRLTVLNGGKA